MSTDTSINCTDVSIAAGLCYQILPSTQLETSLWLSACGGALTLIAFAFLRGNPTWRPILHKRATQIPELLCRPPPLLLSALYRAWSWLIPALTLSDADLLATAGLDPLMLIRFLQLGIQMFFPFTFVGSSVLIPVYRTAGGLASSNSTANADEFMLRTMSNVPRKSLRLWAAFIIMLVGTAWCLWCIWCHCRSYVALRLLHTHGGALLKELGVANGENSSVQGVMRIVGTYNTRNNNSTRITHSSTAGSTGSTFGDGTDGTTASNNTSADEKKKGGKSADSGKDGPWKMAWRVTWRAINPLAMLRADLRLVEVCLERMERHLAEQRRLRRLKTQSRNELEIQGVQRQQQDNDVIPQSDLAAKGQDPLEALQSDSKQSILDVSQSLDGTTEDLLMEMRKQDWGPAVSAAKIPEAVCPWWLPPEECPAAVNPLIEGGGVLLGKTPPNLRARVRGYRGTSQYWVPAASYVVLYRAGGPAPTSSWGKLQEHLQRLNRDEEEEAELDDGIIIRGLDEDDVSVMVNNKNKNAKHEKLEGSAVTAPAIEESGEDGGNEVSSCLPAESSEENTSGVPCSSPTTASGNKLGSAGKELEKSLRRLFPETFQELVPVYSHKEADKAVQRWDSTAAALEKVERSLEKAIEKENKKGDSPAQGTEKAKLPAGTASSNYLGSGSNIDLESGVVALNDSKEPQGATSKSVKKKQQKKKRLVTVADFLHERERLKEELAAREVDVIAARAAALASPLGTAYFALFTSQRDAMVAAEGHIGATPDINMISERAPGPDEINWEGLWAGWKERWWRTGVLCVIPMILIVLFPIGPLTGALTNLPLAVCGGTADTNSTYWPWFCDQSNVHWLVNALLTGILPVTISTFWDTFVMPLVLFLVTQAQRCHASFSALDQAVIKGFYGFSVVNTFIGGVLGGSFLQQIGAALEDSSVIDLIGTALPAASNFFINYIGVHALFTNVFRLIWPHDGTVLFVFFRGVGLHLPNGPRDKWIIRSAPSYRSGRHYGAFMATYIMALSYAAIAPLILPITLLYFLTAFLTWRYCAIHFYEPAYDGGGRVFELNYRLLLLTVEIANVFLSCVLMTKGTFWEGGIYLALSTAMMVAFQVYCDKHVMSYVKVEPLTVAALGPRARVPRELYLPPALRRGAIGWFPEGGKIWEKYGLPKFVT